jgi:hypothetical protein
MWDIPVSPDSSIYATYFTTMPQKHSNQDKSQLQSEKFKAMALELDCIDSNESFDAKLKALAKAQEKPVKSK